MATTSDLDCKIFVEANVSRGELARLCADGLSGTVAAVPWTVTLSLPQGEIELDTNDDYDALQTSQFPDGFLYFRYHAEFYPAPSLPHKSRVALMGDLLRLFWSNGFPAVAACDYEEELPNRGGYKDPTVPWVLPREPSVR